jgi:hypothetical protein
MTTFIYIETDVPEGVELVEWRRSRPGRRRRRFHLPRLRLIG